MGKLLIYDERLNGSPPWGKVNATCLVNQKHPMGDIVNWVRIKCNKYKGKKTLYIMAHGRPGIIQLGMDNLHANNVHMWFSLKSKLSYIVILSCWAAYGVAGESFCSKLASYTSTYVVAADSAQKSTYLPLGILPTSFGRWEGNVHVWNPSGRWIGNNLVID